MSPSSANQEYDVVVIGCGPAGSVTAAELAKGGVRVLALERHEFPRYRIGESLTVSAGNIIREWGLDEEMGRRDFPVKTGVKVVGTSARSEFFVPVAAPTWQVRRSEFDKMLLDHAVAAGADHRWGSVKQILRDGATVTGVAYRPQGSRTDQLVKVHAKVVVDASGHGAVLSTHQIAGRRQVEAFDRQIALFTQFEHARRDPGEMGNNTLIFYGSKHHWGWFIPLSSTHTSVGCVIPTTKYKQVGGDPDAVMAWALENVNPDLHRRVDGIAQTEPVRVIRNYSYRIDPFVGDGWLCVGDSHRFADPIFSFGVSFAMTEARAAACAVLEALQHGDCAQPFSDYAEYSDRGQQAAVDLIRYFWKFPAFFQFQTRGETRSDMIRLLGGDCFTTDHIPVLDMMRRSLDEASHVTPDSVHTIRRAS